MKKLAGPLLLLMPLLAHAEGPPIKLVDFGGRPVVFATAQRDATLLAFWSAACVPCIEEMPLLEALAKKVSGDKHTAIIGVNLDEDSELPAAKKILLDHPVTYPMLRDPQRELVRQWFPKNPDELGLPTILILDRQFHAFYAQGFKPGTSADAFIADWLPRLAEARAGTWHEHLQRLAPKSPGPKDPAKLAQMAQMVEKMVRSHHPELAAADVKLRVEAAMKEFQTKGTFTIE